MSTTADATAPPAPREGDPSTTTIVDAVRSHAAARPASPALHDAESTYTYGDLWRRVESAALRFADRPRGVAVVQLEPTIDTVVHYLAAMHAGMAVLVTHDADAPQHATLTPDVVVRPTGNAVAVTAASDDHGVDAPVHPDLALLLSTSGSTAAPKCVRLSHGALASNAAAIGQYLDIGPTDCAITSLPLHYSYGLSVLHSHLTAGASVVLTTTAVVDPCFWQLVERHVVTSLAAVPHSIEMLERIGFLDAGAPTLRTITVAGGRLDPARVAQWAAAGRRHGWDFVVMYGQTEATARMAYLPPEDACTVPGSIGIAIPGGEIRIDSTDASHADGVGEIVYRGPNVMMGYAERRSDLSAGPTLTELRTGDLGRRDSATGFIEIVGRTSRFIKPMSIRVDLDQLERSLAAAGVTAACTGTDEMVFAVAQIDEHTLAGEADAVVDLLAECAGVPRGCCHAELVEELPRRPNGKVDYAAVAHRQQRVADDAVTRSAETAAAGKWVGDATAERTSPVRACFAEVLRHPDIDSADTFAALGGDSLSFVEVSIRLERCIPNLPRAWHLTTVGDLEALMDSADSHASRSARIDTSIVIRAVSILAVVATHMELVHVPGGAHLMLAIAGYNFARFQLSIPTSMARLAAGVRTAARVGVPAAIWIGLNMVVVGGYSLGTFLLVNDYTGSSLRTDGRWRYWFFEAFVKILIVATVLVAIPALRRLERRAPFGFALAVLAPLLVLRFEIVQWGDPYNYGLRAHSVAWLFALGWAIHRASSIPQRCLISLVTVISVIGFWSMPGREAFVIIGLLAVIWWPEVRVPRATTQAFALLAAMSMWIYLFHPQVYPTALELFPVLPAYAVTLAVCLVMGLGGSRLVALAERAINRRSAGRKTISSSDPQEAPNRELHRRTLAGATPRTPPR